MNIQEAVRLAQKGKTVTRKNGELRLKITGDYHVVEVTDGKFKENYDWMASRLRNEDVLADDWKMKEDTLSDKAVHAEDLEGMGFFYDHDDVKEALKEFMNDIFPRRDLNDMIEISGRSIDEAAKEIFGDKLMGG